MPGCGGMACHTFTFHIGGRDHPTHSTATVGHVDLLGASTRAELGALQFGMHTHNCMKSWDWRRPAK